MGDIVERRRVTSDVVVGMRCDCCGSEFREEAARMNDFRLEHTFGFASVADMVSVKATICDNCLLELVLDRVPGAEIVDHLGGSGRADLRLRLEQWKSEGR